MVRFDSSAIWQADYDPEAQLLRLWFAGDALPYGYRDVPEDVFDGLCAAESQGRYFAAHIRDRYQVIPPPTA
jgi:hypothetical protein